MKIRVLRQKFRYHPYIRPIRLSAFGREKQRYQNKLKIIDNLYQQKSMGIGLQIIPLLTSSTHYFDQRVFPSSVSQIPSLASRWEQTKLLNQYSRKKISCDEKNNPQLPPQLPPQLSPQLPTQLPPQKDISTALPRQLFASMTLKTEENKTINTKLQDFVSTRQIKLQPHQINVLEYLHKGFLLQSKTALLIISRMGSGKTRMVIEFANWLHLNFLILTPNKIVPHIYREIIKWKEPDIYGEVQDARCFTAAHVQTKNETNRMKLLVIDECHLIANKKTKKLVKEIQSLENVWVILLSGTPGDIEDQFDVLTPFCNNVDTKESILEVSWQPEFLPKQELIALTLLPDQWKVFDNAKQHILELPIKEQEKKFMELRKTLSEWKLPFIIQLCDRAQCKSKKSSILVVSEFSEILLALDLRLDKKYTRRRISKESHHIDLILQQFEAKSFQFLLAYSGSISHGIDLAFVNELIYIEPQYLTTNQKQTSGRLPRLGKSNPDQTIINPFYKQTPDDMLYQTHFETDTDVPPELE
jgi:superfamily II DNA or RNA helicase